MTWTKEPPTNPGWYWVRYTGYRSGTRITTIFQLDKPEPGGMFAPAVPLVRVEISRAQTRQEWDLRFHPSCEPVEWAGPIEEPNE